MAVLFPPVSLLMNSSIEDIAIGKLASYAGWQPHCPADDRFWHFGDIGAALFNVRLPLSDIKAWPAYVAE
ncbi:MAG: hypothetical protein WA884_10520 [Methyloceanibacter sp.]